MNKVRFLALLLTIVFCTAGVRANADQQNPTPEERQLLEKYSKLSSSLHPRSGDILLTAANATLHLSNRYYFLGSEDAKRVLVEGWGNSKEAAADVLGMIFPIGKTFVDDTWAAVITYDAQGYVPDSDAKSADYDKLIESVRANEDEVNRQRKAEGLVSLHLVGWAQPPAYDATNHTLIWARNIRFGDQADDTLNYDLRVLGRRGVLSMNIVSQMSHLAAIRIAATQIRAVATFDPGARYENYQPGSDKKASYGIAGLVAAGLGVVAAKKLGLFAIGLLFFKKIGVVIAAAAAGAIAWLRKLFRRGKPPSATG